MTDLSLTSPILRRGAVLAGVLGVALLGGCARVDREFTGSIDYDHRERHAIKLSERPETLDIIVQRGGLDARQAEDVRGFAKFWRESRGGQIVAELPHGGGGATSQTLASIRDQLAKGGASGGMAIRHGGAVMGIDAPVIRLSFTRLQAGVPGACGQWPDDLAGGGRLQSWQNKQYHNFGCSFQHNIAAQVADPRDLVRPRVETPADVQRRSNAIRAIRGEPASVGTDPSTQWRKEEATVEGD
jgi:pilus assembly protein CpaD